MVRRFAPSNVILLSTIGITLAMTIASADLAGALTEASRNQVHDVVSGVAVTRNGVPAVWMIADEDFESIMETLDVLAEAAAMRERRNGARAQQRQLLGMNRRVGFRSGGS